MNTPLQHRFTAAAIVLALACAVAAVSSSVAAQTGIPVKQGQTVLLGTLYFAEFATVDPLTAGTLQVTDLPGDTRGELRFTASTSYIGPATINGIDTLTDPIVIARVVVEGPRAEVGATFTPRPAPGPCIQILSGGTVDFGDVTVGVAKTASTETVVSNCSSGLDVDIFGSVSQATSGTGPSAVVWEPVVSPAGPNQFTYRLFGIESTSALLDNDSSVRVRGLPNGFTRSLSHELGIGAGSSTGLNSQFNATVNLLATVA
jgi:spore coat protein U-like protein